MVISAAYRASTARGRNGSTNGVRCLRCSAPSSESMLGPTTRAVEKFGSSTVKVAASRMTRIAAAWPVTSQPSIAGTQATGATARSCASTVGASGPASSSRVGRSADGCGPITPFYRTRWARTYSLPTSVGGGS